MKEEKTLDIIFVNETDFDYYAIRSYETFIFKQPQIKTEGLFKEGNYYYIVCSQVIENSKANDGTPLYEWFNNNKIAGSNIVIVSAIPVKSTKIPFRSLEEILDYKGSPRNKREVVTDFIGYLPIDFPQIYYEQLQNGLVNIYSERDLSSSETQILINAIRC